MKIKRDLLVLILVVMSMSVLYGQGTPGLEFRLLWGGSGYEVSRGSATDAHVIIPDTHNGLPVRAVADYGFRNYIDLVVLNYQIQ